MQLFCSTHSAVFVQACTDGYLVEQTASDGTRAAKLRVPDLLERSFKAGVSAWQHPLLSHPFNPVVLTDGPIDRDVLSKATEVTGLASNCEFLCLEDFVSTKRSGVGNTLRFLQTEGSLIANRAKDSPLMVLLDWETSGQDFAKVLEAYGQTNSAGRYVLRADEQCADPRVGKTVRGIERFYPFDLFREVHHDLESGATGVAFDAKDRVVVDKQEFMKCKRTLADRLCANGSPEWFSHIAEILKQVEAALAEVKP